MNQRRRGLVGLVALAMTVASAGCGVGQSGSVAASPEGAARVATSGPTTTPLDSMTGVAPFASTSTTPAPPPAHPTTALVRPAAPTTVRTAKPAPTTSVSAPGCPVTLAGQLAATGGGSQLVTVEAPAANATAATVTLWQRAGSCWSPALGPWPARVGVNGLSSNHHEGDGSTPVGVYGISATTYGIAPDPGVHGIYHQLVCGDWWDEDPASPQYNTFQHVDCLTTPPFAGASEALWQQTTAYQHFAVIQYNTAAATPGAGSAIFVHDDHGGPTNGCVSLAPANLDILLRWLQPSQAPHIVIGASSTIRSY
jgi:L,D-peptidoglycan transpeptidase YkuD (ErfK/YbiS/YcfS/YnhG family)